MAKIDQPLLSSLRRTSPSSKTLFITLSSITLLLLLALLSHHVNTENQHQVCKHAFDPSSCQAIISKHSPAGIFRRTDADLLQILIQKSMFNIDDIAIKAAGLYKQSNESNQRAGLENCIEMMDLSHGRLHDCASAINSIRIQSTTPVAEDVYAWLAGVVTNHVTCLDGLNGVAKSTLVVQLNTLIGLAMTSLAVFSSISPSSLAQVRPQRAGDFPSWLRAEDYMVVRGLHGKIKADVVVAKDGSGNYMTIQEAVAMAPENGEARYVIYVKKGRYEEKVVMGRKKKNVVIVGDGMDSTIVTGSLNVADGSTLFDSATFVALGDGFMAQDIWFQNVAESKKGQAVALLVAADRSVINRCRIDGYHNALWAHSLRHLYRDCTISGAINFMFGDAISVLQDCKFIRQKAMCN
ncbi:pectinesterase [Cinnamomum micranthum f. kanehirae]|uniref:Pectinesterase n=1 Tax=Cinnamomum micranthum f. kanehirae TaxID=337451 RepID=A0A3S3NM72_9MAGN|nr:pectinesterase [Cinnamomum micranthum f. kanehirae]